MKYFLITYATKTGSTKKVAEFIALSLTNKGIKTNVLPMNEVTSFNDYTGVIIGAPVNGMQWLPEAKAFITKNMDTLRTLPVAYYLLAVVLNGGRPFFVNKLSKAFDTSSQIVTPVTCGFFKGIITGEPPFILRLIFGLKKDIPKAIENSKEIQDWSEQLIELM
ncbi:MAG: hypothetical protein A2015_10610 [Spirochaetes bacterium GWF1_31_7]|nr:MAG: hypothetical protein A2Y30_16350 [Spirochaetes bacterium GWE1_32_154]OHD48546.1 MAG: hypothetical protein A2Y29_14325 [Spirochaetes bacterium GWE2_31_10]OHD51463.1 MAG: hypothetical protein A2015_10610 [Spirochaetes bacterium GWF1_31_7]HBD93319.1 hypothetical protein [Spirochaetia bacterium]HBI36651.1 hypothetical protein [Spirochaetia bacterium]